MKKLEGLKPESDLKYIIVEGYSTGKKKQKISHKSENTALTSVDEYNKWLHQQQQQQVQQQQVQQQSQKPVELEDLINLQDVDAGTEIQGFSFERKLDGNSYAIEKATLLRETNTLKFSGATFEAIETENITKFKRANKNFVYFSSLLYKKIRRSWVS